SRSTRDIPICLGRNAKQQKHLDWNYRSPPLFLRSFHSFPASLDQSLPFTWISLRYGVPFRIGQAELCFHGRRRFAVTGWATHIHPAAAHFGPQFLHRLLRLIRRSDLPFEALAQLLLNQGLAFDGVFQAPD